jgi:glycosyltransferase involved in cell wall biosynthesis
MLGILHLHPPRCDFQTRRTLELLFRNLGSELAMASRSIGPGGDFQNLAEAIFRLRFGNKKKPDIAHTWSPESLIAAAAAGFPNIIFSPQAPIHPKWRKWIGMILRHRDVAVVSPTMFVQKTLVCFGANPDRCRVIEPAVDVERLGQMDPDIRGQLGLAESDIVLLAPGESDREAMHVTALWSAAILNFLDRKYRLLIWGRGPMVDSVIRFARVSSLDGLLVIAEAAIDRRIDFEQIVRLANVALFCGQDNSPILPLAVCLSAGLPVVATDSALSREILQNGINAMVEPSVNPRRLAQLVREVQSDVSLRQKLVEGARSSGADRFSVARFTAEWRSLYCRFEPISARPAMVVARS